jgi:hypothetical protein
MVDRACIEWSHAYVCESNFYGLIRICSEVTTGWLKVSLQQFAVTLQAEWRSGEVVVYTGTIAKATTCGREQ